MYSGVDPELYKLTTVTLESGKTGEHIADAFTRLMSTVEQNSTSTRSENTLTHTTDTLTHTHTTDTLTTDTLKRSRTGSGLPEAEELMKWRVNCFYESYFFVLVA